MERVGGCLCGETRYEIVGDPVRVIYCHCNDCKKQTSAPYSIVASYAKEQVSIQKPGFLKPMSQLVIRVCQSNVRSVVTVGPQFSLRSI